MSDWQQIAALACVAAAVLYVVWRVMKPYLRREASCGSGCSSCSASAPQIVTLEKRSEGAKERRSEETQD